MLTEIQNVCNSGDFKMVDAAAIAGGAPGNLGYAPHDTIPGVRGAEPPEPAGGASIFTAIQEQLGLKLEPTKGTGEFLVIDQRPSG